MLLTRKPFAADTSSRGIRVLIADECSANLPHATVSLNCIPQVVSARAVGTVAELRSAARQAEYDVLIMDVSFDGHCSFDLVEELRRQSADPEIIFLTESHERAVKAFEIAAADYLLRPVSFERLREAIQRVEKRLWTRLADNRFADLQQQMASLACNELEKEKYSDVLWIKSANQLIQVRVEDIEWFQAAGDYVVAHTADRSHFLSLSMNGLESTLDPNEIVRVHRSSMVNMRRVRTLRRRRPRGFSLVLASGKQVPVGGKYQTPVFAMMKAPRWR